jgi:hypothetical protein
MGNAQAAGMAFAQVGPMLQCAIIMPSALDHFLADLINVKFCDLEKDKFSNRSRNAVQDLSNGSLNGSHLRVRA